MSGFGGYGASPPPGGQPPVPPEVEGWRGSALPVCPRHPDRVSYVSCQRCGRPTCNECQRPATVGIHCVDCVKQASSQRPVVRTMAGGVARDGLPVVTTTIIAICVAIQVLGYVAPALYSQIVSSMIFAPVYGLSEPYRFLTSTFLHGGIWHLAFNMYALWVVGGELEKLLGRARFITLYVLSAIGGSVGYLVIQGAEAGPVVGASGGVFGLFAAFAIMLRRFGRDPRQILVLIAINAVIGFTFDGIAWQAHLGGLVVGGAVAALMAHVPREKQNLMWIGCGGIALALAGLVAFAYA